MTTLRRATAARLALVVLVAAAGCGEGEGRSMVTGAGALGGIRTCEEVRPTGMVDGAPSADAEVAAAQRWRADRGLRSDAAWVAEVATTSTTTPEAASFTHPVTDDEAASLLARDQAAAPVEAVGAYTERFPDTFAGTWIDNRAGGVFTVAFTDDVDERRRELEAVLPAGTAIAVVHAERSVAELQAIQGRITASPVLGDIVDGHGIITDAQVVAVLLRVLDPPSIAALAEAIGAEATAGVCVEGRPPEQLDPEGPQPEGGEGWRLLGEGTSGPVYATLVATDAEGYAALWHAAGFPAGRPDVDLEEEIVVLFGPAVSGSCPQIRLDDVVVDVERRLVHADFAHPGSPAACTDDANPHAFVVAVERAALPPSPFTVQLHEEVVVCEGCQGEEPDEITEVDLRAP